MVKECVLKPGEYLDKSLNHIAFDYLISCGKNNPRHWLGNGSTCLYGLNNLDCVAYVGQSVLNCTQIVSKEEFLNRLNRIDEPVYELY